MNRDEALRTVDNAAAEIRRLTARLAEAERDARRWRFIRSKLSVGPLLISVRDTPEDYYGWAGCYAERGRGDVLDELIDSEIGTPGSAEGESAA